MRQISTNDPDLHRYLNIDTDRCPSTSQTSSIMLSYSPRISVATSIIHTKFAIYFFWKESRLDNRWAHGFPSRNWARSEVSRCLGLGGFRLTFPCHGLRGRDGELCGRGVGGAALWLAFLGEIWAPQRLLHSSLVYPSIGRRNRIYDEYMMIKP